MAHHQDPEKNDLKELDPVGVQTNEAAAAEEPVASPSQSTSSGDSDYEVEDIHTDGKYLDPEKLRRPSLTRFKSSATGVSEVSTTTQATQPRKRTRIRL